MKTERICQNINAIFDRLTNAYASLSVFKSIIVVYDSQEKYLLFPDINFWRTTIDNCIFRALVELAKTYEEGPDAIGLQKLMNQVEQSKSANSYQLVHEALKRYDALIAPRTKLKTLRDKGLVHADKKYMADLKSLLSQYGLSIQEIYNLLNTAAEICNGFLVEFTGESRSVALALNDDASGVLEDVRIAHAVREKRRSGLSI